MKYLLALFAALVAGFTLDWVLYSILLGEYFLSRLTPETELFYRQEESMFMPYMAAQIVAAIFIVWLLKATHSNSAKRGAVAAAAAMLLVSLSFNLNMYASTYKFASVVPYLADVAVSVVTASGMGAIAGWIIKRFGNGVSDVDSNRYFI